MKQKYFLLNAIKLNITGEKYDAIAMQIDINEIKKHQHQFKFNYIQLAEEQFFVYKICRYNEPDIIQGIVAFFLDRGFLYGLNMEVNNFNKKPQLLFDGVGKCMVALCCKISFDEGFDGFVSFEAKNKLFPFYKRLGAKQIGTSIRFYIDTAQAEKLVNAYF